MKSRNSIILLVVVSLLGAGILAHPLEQALWGRVRENQPALQLSEVEGAAGHGIVIGLLSGARALLADLVWIRCYSAWVDNDVDRCFTLINLAVGIDPRPLFFWINGGRMLAYDLPVWRVEQAGGAREIPDSVVERINRDQARRALDFYRKGLLYHPENPWLLVDMANIHQRKLNDMDEAARHYRMAAEVPNAPYFAGRVYGELLRRIGRTREAYEWLTRLYPTLPDDDPSALKAIVLKRIEELERELGGEEEDGLKKRSGVGGQRSDDGGRRGRRSGSLARRVEEEVR